SPKPEARSLAIISGSVEYQLKQYALQQGALEIQYIEEFFLDFPRKKSATEVMQRLSDRDHQILMAEAPLPDDPGTIVPVSFKVAHELRAQERDPKLADLVAQLEYPVIRFVAHPLHTGESKVFLSKRLGQHVLDTHRSRRSVTKAD